MTEHISLRTSISTGFRAPSLAQIYFNSTYTDFVAGVPIDKIIAPNNSPITRLLGIPQLKEETATNFSGGITLGLKNFTASIDGYYANIKDRIVLTGAFDQDDNLIGNELKNLNVGAAQFFTNAINTETYGVDLVLNWAKRLDDGERLGMMFVANYNEMYLGKVKTSERLQGKEDIYFGSREKKFLLASAPKSKMNFAIDYKRDALSFNTRFTYFDEVVLEDWLGTDDVYEAKVVTDLTLGYKVTEGLTYKIGASNLFNVYPTEQDTETESGGIWDPVQMGISGRYIFSKLVFNF